MYAQWLMKNKMAVFHKYDHEQTGQMDSDSIVFSARSFLHGVRSRRAAVEVGALAVLTLLGDSSGQANPDHFRQAAARMRNNHQKVTQLPGRFTLKDSSGACETDATSMG